MAYRTPSGLSRTGSLAAGLVALSLAVMLLLRSQLYPAGGRDGCAACPGSQALSEVTPDNGWFPAQRDPLFSWDDDEQGWVLEDDDPSALTPSPNTAAFGSTAARRPRPAGASRLRVQPAAEKERGKVLAVPVHFPDPATLFRDNAAQPNDKYKLQGVRFISYDVCVPADCAGFVGCLFFLKDKDGLWYQARARSALIPGRWNTVTADIRGGSPDVTPLGHLGQWDENQASRIRFIGITFYGDRAFEGAVLVDNFRGWLRPQRFTQILAASNANSAAPVTAVTPERMAKLRALETKAAAYCDEPLRVLNFRTEPAAAPGAVPAVRKFETLTLRFEVNRQAENPFDPERADVTCLVETPGGTPLSHTAFWYQEYDRQDHFEADALQPLGRPEWRVRITPREEGEYKYTLKVRMRSLPGGEWDELVLPAQTFLSQPSDHPGFVRVSTQDPRYFEFENGAFYYPLGHNLHSPVDVRCWKEVFKQDHPSLRGLSMYEDFFGKMQRHGENTAEVWMSSWWLAIEWTSQWKDYYGPMRYSLQKAWQLDRLLQMARQHDLRIHLVIDNHGKFSNWCDWEWDLNPYNKREANGVVASAQDFFTDEICRKWHRNRLRYIAARWGADPAILGWELVSEYDLVGQGRNRNDTSPRQNFHRGPVLQAWAREMIGWLRTCDSYRHPITNHYATDYTFIDAALACSPLYDYVVTDAYRPDRPYTGIAQRSQQWVAQVLARSGSRKPFWITEFGGDWNATVPAALDADAHCGLWATWMTEGAGTPLFWWYDFVDRNNLYPYYQAFGNYIKGEDRRGLQGAMEQLNILASADNPPPLQGQVFRWRTGAYAWIYNKNAMEYMPAPANRPSHAGVEASLSGLEPGRYRVEFWDCYAGTIVAHDEQTIAENEMFRLKFPPFTNNMAVKVKALGAPADAPQLPHRPMASENSARTHR